MNSLFSSQDFQTENRLQTTVQVANNYGVSESAISKHFSRNKDEIIEGIHYLLDTNSKFGTKTIKWTLEGVYMLGFFVKKSKVAKEYRSKVAKAIAQAREKQLTDAKEARARNLALADKVAALEACAIKDAKDRQNQINGYKSQISQHNALIVKLKSELAIAKSSKPKTSEELERELKKLKRDYEGLGKDWNELTCEYLSERSKNKKLETELKKLTDKTDKKEARLGAELVKIQNALSAVHQAVGAVASYAAYDDEYFLLNLKG